MLWMNYIKFYIKMKKLIFLLPFLIFSCSKVEPIEKYRGKGIVVIGPIYSASSNNMNVRCKTKDSIFYLTLSKFDAEKLREGDTIR